MHFPLGHRNSITPLRSPSGTAPHSMQAQSQASLGECSRTSAETEELKFRYVLPAIERQAKRKAQI